MVRISVDIFSKNDLDIFLIMTNHEYGASDTTNRHHVKWKHLDSPFTASTYVCLVDDKKVVGRALLQPRKLRMAKKVFSVASVMDLLIEQKYRSSPVNFINITKACGNIESFDLVFHTSNERTFPLYSKLFRFSNPFSLKAYGFPVRLAGLSSLVIGRRLDVLDCIIIPFHWLIYGVESFFNLIASLDVSERDMSDEELETLSLKCLRQSAPHLERTNSFLKWRFKDAPIWHGTIYRIDRKGMFLGYVVTRKMKLDGLTHLVLMDFIIDPDTPFIAIVALRLWLIRKAITSKADVLFTMLNSVSIIAQKCIGFPLINIPEKFLPHSTPIFIRTRSNESSELEINDSIHMTLADLDYI